jgi:hypothetical protein
MRTRYNLQSPNNLTLACDLDQLNQWFLQSLGVIENQKIRGVIEYVCQNIEAFVEWPNEAVLFWEGCDRVAEKGKRQKYHRFPVEVKQLAKQRSITLDSRPNGPAIAAFLFARGIRPNRWGSSNAWSIHHIYSGKFPYVGNTTTLHAKKDPKHFTQSAGLIAVHPVADGLCDEYPSFAWLLRAQAFSRFGYDPDRVFATKSHDAFGFVSPFKTQVLYSHSNA